MPRPRLDVDQIKIRPIEKGGSDRKFYRIQCGADSAAAGLVLVKYNLEREENRHYVQIAQFLDAHGIRVPRIYFHDPVEGLIWIEDLGERDLYSCRDETWLVRRAFYESALDQIVKLHSLPESVCLEMKEHLPAEFNAALVIQARNGVQQADSVGVSRCLVDLLHRSGFHHMSGVHHIDILAGARYYSQVMGNQHHACPRFVAQVAQQAQDLGLHRDVQCRRRLVGHDEPGAEGEPAKFDKETLPPATVGSQ